MKHLEWISCKTIKKTIKKKVEKTKKLMSNLSKMRQMCRRKADQMKARMTNQVMTAQARVKSQQMRKIWRSSKIS